MCECKLTPSAANRGRHSVMQPAGSSPAQRPLVGEAGFPWQSWCEASIQSENTNYSLYSTYLKFQVTFHVM